MYYITRYHMIQQIIRHYNSTLYQVILLSVSEHLSHEKIENPKSSLPCIPTGIHRTAAFSYQIANSCPAVIHQMVVSLVYTVRRISARYLHHFVIPGFDVLISYNILAPPVSVLLLAGQHQEQAELKVFFFFFRTA